MFLPLIFSLKTASQGCSGQLIVGRVAALSTVRVIGGLVLSHEVVNGQSAGAERRAGPVEVDSRGWTITLTVCEAAKGKLVSMLKTSDPIVL